MATRKFALERGGPKRLELRWRRGLKDFEVSVDGTTWKLEPDAVRAGAAVALAGGSALFVKWDRRRFWSVAFRDDLRVERDGVPLPGSDGDPRVIARRASRVILLFGFLRVLFVGLLQAFDPSAVVASGSMLVALSGLVLLALGAVAAFGRRLPLAIAAGLLALELAVMLGMSLRLAPTGIVVQALVIVHLVQSWQRARPRVAAPTLGAIFE